ncbi:Protein of unknown function [Pyronema omphalodes CBS 100304]|uniref:Uncharacterized protein n=1 Tax=Pyronema omphalodes (strain CBS 100304) TaxID=1076935 RepID=U4KYL5_PYROM|nr:Protein of unknown function [Pyronema omphalodes CBS 100304]
MSSILICQRGPFDLHKELPLDDQISKTARIVHILDRSTSD